VDTQDPEQLLAVAGALPLLLSCGFAPDPARPDVLRPFGCTARREVRSGVGWPLVAKRGDNSAGSGSLGLQRHDAGCVPTPTIGA